MTGLSRGYAESAAVAPPPGKGLIYLMARNTGSFGNLLISVNGKVVDSVVANSYVVLAVDPGRQRIASAGAGSFELTTAAGGIYYLQLRIGPGSVPQFRSLSADDDPAALACYRKLR